MKDNKGFSLVEMIIVVAILAALVLVGGIGLTYVQGREAERATQKIVSVFREAQAVSMSKYETKVILKYDENKDIVAVIATKDKESSEAAEEISRICDSTVSIMCGGKAPADNMTFLFDRTSGGFKEYPDTVLYIEKAATKKEVTITPGTGKISIE